MHRVKIHQGDISQLDVYVIVNTADYGLAGGNGVSSAIRRAAGDELEHACQAIGHCPVGEIRVTPGFRLAANMVIHTVGSAWRGGEHREEQLLASCYHKTMIEAKKHNVKSIAFPAISCGESGFPTRRAIKVAIAEVNSALRQNPLMESVVFCCFDPVTTALYRNQIGK